MSTAAPPPSCPGELGGTMREDHGHLSASPRESPGGPLAPIKVTPHTKGCSALRLTGAHFALCLQRPLRTVTEAGAPDPVGFSC